jgi:hypothetical protein
MPRNSRSDASSSESENDDAPESISLSRSKKDTQKLDAERRNAEVTQRRIKREKNRNMDRKLKERAVTNKKGKVSVDGIIVERRKRRKVDAEKDEGQSDKPDELEKRMRRAMKDAEGEDELEGNGEEFMGIDKGEGAAEDDYSSSGIDDNETGVVSNPDHLPDELFAAAFSSSSKRKILGKELKPPATKKRKKSSSSSKDTIIGFVLQSKSIYFIPISSRSRAIRILPNASAPPVPSTIPSKKINRFLDRTLALKNGMQNLYTKGWERRPGNIYFSAHCPLFNSFRF